MAATPQPTLRADARRNRERIVAVAAECFAVEGVECQVAEIARRAEVGNATVFRHFPTKQDLVVAVMEEKMRGMVAVADEALRMDEPGAALRHFVRAMCRLHVVDHALKQTSAVHLAGQQRLVGLRDELLERLGRLVDAAKAAGAVREDVEAVDFVILVKGVATAVVGLEDERPGLHERYLELALAGMRPSADGARPLPSAPPSADELDAAWQRQSALGRDVCG